MKKIIPITGLVLSMTVGSVGAATEITKTELNKNTGILSAEGNFSNLPAKANTLFCSVGTFAGRTKRNS